MRTAWQKQDNANQSIMPAPFLLCFNSQIVPSSLPQSVSSLSIFSLENHLIPQQCSFAASYSAELLQNKQEISAKQEARRQCFPLGRCASLSSHSQGNCSFTIFSAVEVKSTCKYPVNVQVDRRLCLYELLPNLKSCKHMRKDCMLQISHIY